MWCSQHISHSLLLFLVLFSSLLRKSSNTVLLHLGHLGSTSDNITYKRHRGHPTRSIALVSSASEDTQELSSDCTDTGDNVEDSVDDSSEEDIIEVAAALGGDKFSLSSNLGLLALLLIFLSQY